MQKITMESKWVDANLYECCVFYGLKCIIYNVVDEMFSKIIHKKDILGDHVCREE